MDARVLQTPVQLDSKVSTSTLRMNPDFELTFQSSCDSMRDDIGTNLRSARNSEDEDDTFFMSAMRPSSRQLSRPSTAQTYTEVSVLNVVDLNDATQER